MNDPAPARIRRWWRSSRFLAIAAGTLAGHCMAVLFVWSANDASFRPALLQWEVSLGLRKLLVTGPTLGGDWGLNDPNRTLRWDGLGKRVIALHVFVWTGVAATALLAVLAFRPPNVRRILAVVALIVGWGLLCATQTRVDDWRARRQIAAIFPQIEEAGLTLSKQWPTKTTTIAPNLEVWGAAPNSPNFLIVHGQRDELYPLREKLGSAIERWDNGILNFRLSPSHELSIEYHPNGTLPFMQKNAGFGFPSPPVARYYRIKKNWYLVRYGGM